jgi:hypothetical protein
MDNIVQDAPNLPVAETVPVQKIDSGLESIAAKMAAMRNQVVATNPVETGVPAAAATETPVAPEGVEVNDDENTEPEVDATTAEDADATDDAVAPEEVSTANTSAEELIDFLDFAEQNPNAKFKFMRNGKEIVIDAKKAASILGQGAAISEDARQLKVEKAEFDEYLTQKRQETEGLLLAMEFTVRPQLQKAYDEIIKTQGYQNTFQQQLAQATDPAQIARIQASMAQNENYIRQQSAIRKNQVNEILENNRKNFADKELKNSYVYNEIREKVAKDWAGAKSQLVPGVDNIDLISSDEHILSLLRDGLKYRDRPKAKSAGGSIAALTNRKAGTAIPSGEKDEIQSLRSQARGGDKKAADNLLMAQLRQIRASRSR